VEGERLLGADGPGTATRLGLPADAPAAELRTAALDAMARWQDAAADPLARRATRDAVAVVVQSCEAMLAELDADSDAAPDAERSGGRAAEPAPHGPGAQGDAGQDDEARLREERDPVDVGPAGHDALRDVGGRHAQHAGDQQDPPAG